MPYYKIKIVYGTDQEYIIKAETKKDADDYADELERDYYVSVNEIEFDEDTDYLDDDLIG